MKSTENEYIKIAICGGLRSGKDSVGDLLQKEFDAGRFAFSDGIWRTLELLFPLEYAKRHSTKPRRLLQQLGQKMREIYPFVWIDYTLRRIEVLNRNVVLSDMRQPNEYEALKEAGFITIRIDTDVEKRIERATLAGDSFDESNLNHETETHYSSFDVDYVIDNNGSIADMENQVFAIVEDIAGGRR